MKDETFEQFFKRHTGALVEEVPAYIVRNWREYWRQHSGSRNRGRFRQEVEGGKVND